MEVKSITPRGYCYGVVDAIALTRKVAKDPDVPKPVHVLGLIVHNRHAVADLENYGVINLDGQNRLELLEAVDEGTVIFTAHGVSPEVKRRAREKGLHCVDATCPDVTHTHELIRDHVDEGYEVIYIGKKGHPEPEGAVGEAPESVHLIETEEDLEALDLEAEKLAVMNQTTLSKWDTEALIEKVVEKYPDVVVHNEICMATQLRQEAVAEQAKGCDLVLVVGDTRSNNSKRLVQVAREITGVPAHLIGTVEEIRPEWLEGKEKVAVTAGASTPSQLTREVIQFLEEYEDGTVPESSAAMV